LAIACTVKPAEIEGLRAATSGVILVTETSVEGE
jgi:hypothetical protein